MYQKKTKKWVLATTFVALFLSFSLSCFAFEKEIKTMASVLAESILKTGRKTIAVVDFNDLQGNVTELGRFFAEEFSVALASAGKGFEVVDRTNLKTILIEHKLSTTGIIDPQTARKLGQIAGVDALITGTITPFGDTVRITVKILDTNTARVIGASSGDIAKTKAIEELLEKGIEGSSTSQSATSLRTTNTSQRSNQKSVIKSDTNNFTFELKQCKMSGTTITCEVLITNNEKDKQLEIYGAGYYGGYSRMIDNKGNEYKADLIQLGSNSIKKHGNVGATLVSGIPTTAKFSFIDLAEQPDFIALLDIRCLSNYEWFNGQLRNIPISK